MMKYWKNKKFYAILSALILVFALLYAGEYYRRNYQKNVQKGQVVLYIYEGDGFQQVVEQLEKQEALADVARFRKVAHAMHYETRVKSGHYLLTEGMGNKALVRMLSQGWQQPVLIRFNNLRTLEQLAGVLSKQLMLDSLTLIQTFRNEAWQDSLGFTQETAPAFFLPDTYEVWWNCSPERLMRTFASAYRSFWNDERLNKAAEKNLTALQAATLASIIEEESNKKDEWPIIAGLYLNRMKKRMYLQACPTVKFALNDFSIQRVLKEHTEVLSPYNTYRHMGLPPGPIRIPSIAAQEAVVNAQVHRYLYMCAKDDFSGGHYFSSTLVEHNRYAERYHKALNKRRIMH